MKSSTRVPLFVFTLISAAVLYAQTAPKPFVWAALQPALMQTVPPTTAPVGDALPQISELERTKLENLQLKFQMLQQQQQQLQQSYSELIHQISAEHPGYTFDPQTSSLRKIPLVTSTPAKPTPAVKQ
jgi:hypothetical protein